MEPKQETSMVDNPGGGDCGYYSLEIALIPTLVEELLQLAAIKKGSIIELFAPDAKFFEHMTANKGSAPILFKIYDQIKKGNCRLDSPENIDTSKNTEQEKLLRQWVLGIIALQDLHNLSSPTTADRETLEMGVYLLRTLLAFTRKDDVSKTINGIRGNLFILSEQIEQSKNIIAQLNKGIDQINVQLKTLESSPKTEQSQKYQEDLIKEKDKIRKKIEDEFKIVTMGENKKRLTAFRHSFTDYDTTGIASDILTVLAKNMNRLSQEDLRSVAELVTIKNEDINKYTEFFLSWWESTNNNILPDEYSEQDYKMQISFIATLYGNINFIGKENIDNDINKWWENPIFDKNSEAVKVAKLVEKMGTWATEVDLFALARTLGIDLNIKGYQFDRDQYSSQQKASPKYLIQNRGNNHWLTHLPIKLIAARKIWGNLHQELADLSKQADNDNDSDAKKIIDELITALNYHEKSSLFELKSGVDKFEKQLAQNKIPLEKYSTTFGRFEEIFKDPEGWVKKEDPGMFAKIIFLVKEYSKEYCQVM